MDALVAKYLVSGLTEEQYGSLKSFFCDDFSPMDKVEAYLKTHHLDVTDLGKPPTPQNIRRYLDAKFACEKISEDICWDLFPYEFDINNYKKSIKHMTYEQIYNRKIQDSCVWERIYKQPHGCIWKREYELQTKDGKFDVISEFVVDTQTSEEPPGFGVFGQSAHRFSSYEGASMFLKRQGDFDIFITQDRKAISGQPIRENRRIHYIYKDDYFVKCLDQSKDPNCEIKSGYIKTIKDISPGDFLSLRETIADEV